jgi:hypothetical protein
MPARLPRATHVIKVGNNPVLVRLPDVYSGTGSTIGTAVGVTKLAGEPPAGAQQGKISELQLNGQVAKIRISYRNAAGKYRTADVICDLDNYKTAIGTLPTKQYRGSNIIEAYIPRRRRLG